MKIYVDIDNTICYTNEGDYPNSKPNYVNISKVNKLYEDHTIIMWTARGTMTVSHSFWIPCHLYLYFSTKTISKMFSIVRILLTNNAQ